MSRTPWPWGLDELRRLAAQGILRVALLAERLAYLEAHVGGPDAAGKPAVVGNGYARPPPGGNWSRVCGDDDIQGGRLPPSYRYQSVVTARSGSVRFTSSSFWGILSLE